MWLHLDTQWCGLNLSRRITRTNAFWHLLLFPCFASLAFDKLPYIVLVAWQDSDNESILSRSVSHMDNETMGAELEGWAFTTRFKVADSLPLLDLLAGPAGYCHGLASLASCLAEPTWKRTVTRPTSYTTTTHSQNGDYRDSCAWKPRSVHKIWLLPPTIVDCPLESPAYWSNKWLCESCRSIWPPGLPGPPTTYRKHIKHYQYPKGSYVHGNQSVQHRFP